MAPSQNQEMETLQYTHKKFNCGYSHKKLGMRLLRRNSQDEEIMQQQEQTPAFNHNTSKATLFRPYDLDNKTTTNKTSSTQSQVPDQAQLDHYMHLYALQQSAQQSQEQYALKLQRQRAALYMKHVMQFYENGNGWPSVHPNAINNPAFYNNC
ncbi:uncharacterized protein LOC135950884 [Calliphora vicina]|uniref:uncharacterized protein LOC135950884 n=1 Tax=Calliphora vicina TaxID=7373 RepID=UPI00325A5E1F